MWRHNRACSVTSHSTKIHQFYRFPFCEWHSSTRGSITNHSTWWLNFYWLLECATLPLFLGALPDATLTSRDKRRPLTVEHVPLEIFREFFLEIAASVTCLKDNTRVAYSLIHNKHTPFLCQNQLLRANICNHRICCNFKHLRWVKNPLQSPWLVLYICAKHLNHSFYLLTNQT